MKALFLLFFTGLIWGCSKDSSADAVATPARNMFNVSYGTDPSQKMDIYLPEGRSTSSTPFIILIHGGAWSTGDKNDFNIYVDSLRKRLPGYAIFNINYRLATGTSNFFPSQENDVKSAIEFIYDKRAEYLTSDKFVLLGASAGGHLALLQGLKHTTVAKPKAIVDFFGPTDMVDLYNNPASPLIPPPTIAMIVGATPTTNPVLYHDSSPVNYVDATDAPVIILHGGLDPLVSPTQSEALRALLQSSGVVHEYVFYPTEGHGWAGAKLTDSFDRIQDFLEIHVQ